MNPIWGSRSFLLQEDEQALRVGGALASARHPAYLVLPTSVTILFLWVTQLIPSTVITPPDEGIDAQLHAQAGCQ